MTNSITGGEPPSGSAPPPVHVDGLFGSVNVAALAAVIGGLIPVSVFCATRPPVGLLGFVGLKPEFGFVLPSALFAPEQATIPKQLPKLKT
jgi:hypothetical protein